MPLFTLEVDGHPVLVFPAGDRAAAEDLAASSVGPDLMGFEEEGRPVWDGEDELSVREAGPGEVARWEEGLAEARRVDGAGGEDAGDYAVFLVDADPGAEAG